MRILSQAFPRSILAAYIAVVMMSATSQAGLVFEFVQDGTGDVLVTLELTSLPATHSEVAGLTFTPAGEAIFGLGSVYGSTFDSTSAGQTVVSDGFGGLTSSGGLTRIFDNSPPAGNSFTVTVDNITNGGGGTPFDDLEYFDSFGSLVTAQGTFTAVPEPSSFLFMGLVGIAMGAASYCRQRFSQHSDL